MDSQNFTFTPKTSKTSRRVVETPPRGGGYMEYLPILVALGTIVAMYFLYKEFKKSEKEQYELGQTVKNLQAKLERPFMGGEDIYPYEESDASSDSDVESVAESADEEIQIKQSVAE